MAGTEVALKRQRSVPKDSADDEKPRPSTVTGVPPSNAPRTGHTNDTAAAGRYVNAAAFKENCCPFIDTSICRPFARGDGGAVHSSC
jgi:hypothetical protein